MLGTTTTRVHRDNAVFRLLRLPLSARASLALPLLSPCVFLLSSAYDHAHAHPFESFVRDGERRRRPTYPRGGTLLRRARIPLAARAFRTEYKACGAARDWCVAAARDWPAAPPNSTRTANEVTRGSSTPISVRMSLRQMREEYSNVIG